MYNGNVAEVELLELIFALPMAYVSIGCFQWCISFALPHTTGGSQLSLECPKSDYKQNKSSTFYSRYLRQTKVGQDVEANI